MNGLKMKEKYYLENLFSVSYFSIINNLGVLYLFKTFS